MWERGRGRGGRCEMREGEGQGCGRSKIWIHLRILFNHHPLTLSPFHIVIMSCCHYANLMTPLSPYTIISIAILSPVTLSPCHIVTLSHCHPVTLSPCWFVQCNSPAIMGWPVCSLRGTHRPLRLVKVSMAASHTQSQLRYYPSHVSCSLTTVPC